MALGAVLVLAMAIAMSALPASAAAASGYEVEGTGDEAKSVAGDECETAAGECTLRAAIEAANEGPDRDRIFFSSVFHGDDGETLVLGSPLPPITQPVRIDATPCEPGPQAPPTPCVPVVAPAGSVAIDVAAGEVAVEGLMISGARVGIKLSGGAASSKVEGNEITTPAADSDAIGIQILNGPNDIFANVIKGTCCSSGIVLGGNAEDNRIGGDTAQSENVIDGFQNGAISMTLAETSRNEVARNRGLGGGQFIGLFKADGAEAGFPNQIDAPVIEGSYQSSASGTAKPGAAVRVFRKATAGAGEIEGFLGLATADASGRWKATFATVPLGTLIATTQTFGGGTSQLSGVASTAADPPPDNGGGEGGGNGTGGGGGSDRKPDVVIDHFPPPVTPKARITAGRKGASKSTTAKFRFTSSVPGSGFECRLDHGKFVVCHSPRTYRHLKPGKHVFRVRAVGAGGRTGAAVKRSFRVTG